MPSGRRVRLVGKAMIINLNNKGGVRKAKKTTPFNTCVGVALAGKKFPNRAAQRLGFTKAAQGCKGKR
jgi:hypothetical protein